MILLLLLKVLVVCNIREKMIVLSGIKCYILIYIVYILGFRVVNFMGFDFKVNFCKWILKLKKIDWIDDD